MRLYLLFWTLEGSDTPQGPQSVLVPGRRHTASEHQRGSGPT